MLKQAYYGPEADQGKTLKVHPNLPGSRVTKQLVCNHLTILAQFGYPL